MFNGKMGDSKNLTAFNSDFKFIAFASPADGLRNCNNAAFAKTKCKWCKKKIQRRLFHNDVM